MYILTLFPFLQDLLNKVEAALEEQKSKGRRMIIEEIEGSESDSEYDTPPENGINGLDDGPKQKGQDPDDVDISSVKVRETNDKPNEKPQAVKAQPKPAAKSQATKSEPTKPQKDSKPKKSKTEPVKEDIKSESKSSKSQQITDSKSKSQESAKPADLKAHDATHNTPVTKTKEKDTASKVKSDAKGDATKSDTKADATKADTSKPVKVTQPERPKTPPPLPKVVADLKAKGNDLFKNGRYGDAIAVYDQGIQKLKKGE